MSLDKDRSGEAWVNGGGERPSGGAPTRAAGETGARVRQVTQQSEARYRTADGRWVTSVDRPTLLADGSELNPRLFVTAPRSNSAADVARANWENQFRFEQWHYGVNNNAEVAQSADIEATMAVWRRNEAMRRPAYSDYVKRSWSPVLLSPSSSSFVDLSRDGNWLDRLVHGDVRPGQIVVSGPDQAAIALRQSLGVGWDRDIATARYSVNNQPGTFSGGYKSTVGSYRFGAMGRAVVPLPAWRNSFDIYIDRGIYEAVSRAHFDALTPPSLDDVNGAEGASRMPVEMAERAGRIEARASGLQAALSMADLGARAVGHQRSGFVVQVYNAGFFSDRREFRVFEFRPSAAGVVPVYVRPDDPLYLELTKR